MTAWGEAPDHPTGAFNWPVFFAWLSLLIFDGLLWLAIVLVIVFLVVCPQ